MFPMDEKVAVSFPSDLASASMSVTANIYLNSLHPPARHLARCLMEVVSPMEAGYICTCCLSGTNNSDDWTALDSHVQFDVRAIYRYADLCGQSVSFLAGCQQVAPGFLSSGQLCDTFIVLLYRFWRWCGQQLPSVALRHPWSFGASSFLKSAPSCTASYASLQSAMPSETGCGRIQVLSTAAPSTGSKSGLRMLWRLLLSNSFGRWTWMMPSGLSLSASVKPFIARQV